MKRFQAVIFDCDGVLFESRQANLAYYNAILESFGEAPVLPEEQGRAHLCHTAASPEVFRVLLGQERVAEAVNVAAAIDYRQFIPFMQPEPGMVEALEALSAKVPLAVATNRGTSMPEILRHFSLSHYFSTVVTCKDVERPKPFPDMLTMASRRLRISEQDILFIGDSELDRDAARAAGVSFASYKGDLGADIELCHHGETVNLVLGSAAGQGDL